MARMHSRKKGKSGSKKPIKKTLPSWLGYKAKEVELLIAKISKEGKTPSEIGIVLRDVYGIPDVRRVCGKKINQILIEKSLSKGLPEDLLSLIKKSVALTKHIGNNKQDQSSKRGLLLTQSKINRLVKYYKRTGKISEDWKYDPKKAAMFVE